MFGWRKKQSGPTKEQLHEAYLKRLAEVLGMPERDLIPANAPCPPGAGSEVSQSWGIHETGVAECGENAADVHG